VVPPARRGAFLRIGQVAELLGVQAHVLRYWEKELPLQLVTRTRGNQRLYADSDVDKLARVKALVVGEGVSVRKLRRIIEREGLPEAASRSRKPDDAPQTTLPVDIVAELKAIRDLLSEKH
jgi:DNA-binding transcriptional MerR regulator